MSKLILDSLRIEGFRTFRDLRIEELGRVNLIVGKNSVGKTALLEALWLLSCFGSPYELFALLDARDELPVSSLKGTNSTTDFVQQQLALHHLFHGRESELTFPRKFFIGSLHKGNPDLQISIAPLGVSESESGYADLPLIRESRPRLSPHTIVIRFSSSTMPVLAISIETLTDFLKHHAPFTEYDAINAHLIRSNGISDEQIYTLWDNIALTDFEDDVIDALRLVEPQIERITLINAGTSPLSKKSGQRIPVVRLHDEKTPVPLKSLSQNYVRQARASEKTCRKTRERGVSGRYVT